MRVELASWWKSRLEELAQTLEEGGYSVTLEEIPSYGKDDVQRSVGFALGILIFVGSGAATALVSAVVTDAYNSAKKWVMDRHPEKDEEVAPLNVSVRMTVIDSHGNFILYWEVDSVGIEREDKS